ncbi:hypothetical protein [Lentzea sp.]|uniref:hypothetical protein n=1 Tax=Lentzea sp. TaxID=56099 RepID=UPI002C4814CE|nr:hypothetical protein [Lentzea sp.]HUQ61551.1 hypothetical protein [Lentzea sp.]
MARRLGADPADDSDPRAQAVIAAAPGCVEAALTTWTSTARPQALSKVLDLVMEAMSTLVAPTPVTRPSSRRTTRKGNA